MQDAPLVADRAYLSIGEVLSLLKEEFPDITISKIRFLESQGLLDPERTPSGYRKFYEGDVERLRWILQQQRENFLPLKVIKGRLGVEDTGEPDDETLEPVPSPPTRSEGRPPQRPDRTENRPENRPAHRPEGRPANRPANRPEARPQPGPERREEQGGGPRDSRPAPPPPKPAVPPPRPAATPPRSDRPSPPLPSNPAPAPAGDQAANYTLEELAEASDLTLERLAELEKYGLVAGRKVAGSTYYDEHALHVAKVAAGFLRFGVEARHLRIYKTSAEREAGFFEQIVMPMLKQRNPDARRQALDTLSQLGQLGGQLRVAMLREALRQYTTGL
jgi:DNA-binding transcriptional MerR regulator